MPTDLSDSYCEVTQRTYLEAEVVVRQDNSAGHVVLECPGCGAKAHSEQHAKTAELEARIQ